MEWSYALYKAGKLDEAISAAAAAASAGRDRGAKHVEAQAVRIFLLSGAGLWDVLFRVLNLFVAICSSHTAQRTFDGQVRFTMNCAG